MLVDNLGMSYGITGDLQKAKETFDYGVSKDPTYPLFYYNLACTYAEMNDTAKAGAYLEKAFDYKANVLPGETMPDSAHRRLVQETDDEQSIPRTGGIARSIALGIEASRLASPANIVRWYHESHLECKVNSQNGKCLRNASIAFRTQATDRNPTNSLLIHCSFASDAKPSFLQAIDGDAVERNCPSFAEAHFRKFTVKFAVNFAAKTVRCIPSVVIP